METRGLKIIVVLAFSASLALIVTSLLLLKRSSSFGASMKQVLREELNASYEVAPTGESENGDSITLASQESLNERYLQALRAVGKARANFSVAMTVLEKTDELERRGRTLFYIACGLLFLMAIIGLWHLRNLLIPIPDKTHSKTIQSQ